MGQRPLWGSGFVLRESTSGSAPSAGAQSPPLAAVTPAPELRCCLRPKGLYTAVLPTGKTRLLVPHLYRKVGNQKGNQGAAGVTLHTRRPPAHAELLLLAVCVASSARAASSGCPGCVLLVAGPCQQLLGPSAHTAEPAEAPGSAPVPARALGTVTLCGPPSPSVGASDSLLFQNIIQGPPLHLVSMLP